MGFACYISAIRKEAFVRAMTRQSSPGIGPPRASALARQVAVVGFACLPSPPPLRMRTITPLP